MDSPVSRAPRFWSEKSSGFEVEGADRRRPNMQGERPRGKGAKSCLRRVVNQEAPPGRPFCAAAAPSADASSGCQGTAGPSGWVLCSRIPEIGRRGVTESAGKPARWVSVVAVVAVAGVVVKPVRFPSVGEGDLGFAAAAVVAVGWRRARRWSRPWCVGWRGGGGEEYEVSTSHLCVLRSDTNRRCNAPECDPPAVHPQQDVAMRRAWKN